MTFNVPDEITCSFHDDKVKFSLDGLSTGWMDRDDLFIERIDKSVLNSVFLKEHIIKEIEIKNALDEAKRYLDSQKFSKAIAIFDEVLFYDFSYGEALIFKSYALFGQHHFVKSLRYYRKAVCSDSRLEDVEYYRMLLKSANEERSNFPKLKRNIYAGDENFTKGDYVSAVESYNRALANPSRFKEKILFKLLNKKGTALLKLDDFKNAFDCFGQSLDVEANDYAYFAKGLCEFSLGVEIDDSFKGFLKIDKECMLEQVMVLNESGFFTQSLAICDFLMKNHFRTDEFYLKLLNFKKYALEGLDEDSGEISNILNMVSVETDGRI